jgi:hypothetical protein
MVQVAHQAAAVVQILVLAGQVQRDLTAVQP